MHQQGSVPETCVYAHVCIYLYVFCDVCLSYAHICEYAYEWKM